MSKRMRDRAAALGIAVDGMTFEEVQRAIYAAPATSDQTTFMAALMHYLGRPAQATLTYGQATRILNEVAPFANQRVLHEKGWREGTLLAWRDGHYLVLGVNANARLVLERVEYSPASGDEPERIRSTNSDREARHPLTLLYDDAEAIDYDPASLRE